MKTCRRFSSLLITLVLFLLGRTFSAHSAPVQLTTSGFHDFQPQWNAAGTKIAYMKQVSSGGSIYDIGQVNADGSGEGFLATGVNIQFYEISWLGSTGKLLVTELNVFHELMEFNAAAYTTAAPFARVISDGNDAAFTRKLLVPGGNNSNIIVASRDGSTVAWRDQPNAGGTNSLTIRTALYSSLSGQNTNAIGTVVITATNPSIGTRGLALTPNGSQLVIALPAGTGFDLWRYNSNGSGSPVQLTSDGSLGIFNGSPDISADGTKIIFTRSTVGAGGSSEIYRMNLNGTELTNLTNTAGVDEAHPSWAPNGTDYAFIKLDGGGTNWNIYKDTVPVPTTPTVTSPTAVAITGSTATLGGNVTQTGGETITARGVVFAPTATNAAPALDGLGVTVLTEGGTTTGIFSAIASGLAPGASYSFAAYATNSIGTGYSSVGTFTTPDTMTETPTLIAPATNAVTGSPVSVSFSLPEAALNGSVTLSFGSTVLTLANSQGTSGAHTFSFNPAAPTASAQVASGAAVADGAYTVTLSYQDALGNPAATAVATGVMIDTTAPTFSLPANIMAEATSEAGAVVTYTASASDAGSGVASSSFLPASGSTFPFGTTTVNASATDNAGNMAMGSFTVTVADTLAPTIGGTFAPLSIVAGTVLPDFTVQATTFDAVGVTSVTQSPAAGSATSAGTLSVTVTAHDAAGHTANVSFDVTVTPADPTLTVLSSKGGAVPLAGVDARIQAGAVWTTFGVPSVNEAGQVAFLGSWSAPKAGVLPAQTGTGIFLNGVLVVKKGAAAPGITNAVISTMKDPLLGPDGSVAFVAALANAPLTTGAVVATDNAAIFLDSDGAGAGAAVLIARKGAEATGAAAAASVPVGVDALPEWGAFTSVSLGANAVAFTATMPSKTVGILGSPGPGGVTSLTDSGLWVYNRTTSTMALALREGDPLLSSTVKVIAALAARTGSAGQGRGVVNDGFEDYAVARVTLGDARQALGYIGQDGTGEFTHVAGADAEGYGAGAKWLSFGLPTQNSVSAAMAFVGTVKALTGTATTLNNVAIFAEDDVNYEATRLVSKGDAAGVNGGVFSVLKDPVSAGGRAVAFLGTMKVVPGITAADNDGVWSFSGVSGLDLVAREGALAAEAGGGVWKTFTSLALPEGRGPLFVASLINRTGTTLPALPGPGGITTANDVGLWATDSLGGLRLLLQEGDVIGASTVKTFVVLSSVVGSPAQTRSFNSGGSVMVKATDALGGAASPAHRGAVTAHKP